MDRSKIPEPVPEFSPKDPELAFQYRSMIRAIKLVSQPLVKAKIQQLQEVADLSPAVEITLRWIVTMTLAETEYVRVTEPGYLSKLSFWIVNGHFPCGWMGEFPNGNLIIY